MNAEQKKLIKAVEALSEKLEKAKAELKAHLKDNPLEIPAQPTLHEIRRMQEKLAKESDLDHTKANAALAAKVAKEALINEAKSAN